MPQEIMDQEALVEAVKKLELTSELFEEQNGKAKYAGDVSIKDPTGGQRKINQLQPGTST